MSDWNARVKCTKEFNPGKGVTLGQTYKVVKGKITYDNGHKSMYDFENLKELNSNNSAKFTELKKPGRPKKSI